MDKISKDFWGSEILLCGCERRDVGYYKLLYQSFKDNGVEVYALPTEPEQDPGFKTYPNLEALPHIPECAFVLSPKEEVPKMVKKLRKAGVSRILLYKKKKADDDLVSTCAKQGVEIRCGCPLMLYKNFPCSLHAAVSGVREERKK